METRVSHGPGAINEPNLVAPILRDQLKVSEADSYECVENGILPPRPAPAAFISPSEGLDGKLVRNLILKVGLTQEQVALLGKQEAVAAWQAYLASGGN